MPLGVDIELFHPENVVIIHLLQYFYCPLHDYHLLLFHLPDLHSLYLPCYSVLASPYHSAGSLAKFLQDLV